MEARAPSQASPFDAVKTSLEAHLRYLLTYSMRLLKMKSYAANPATSTLTEAEVKTFIIDVAGSPQAYRPEKLSLVLEELNHILNDQIQFAKKMLQYTCLANQDRAITFLYIEALMELQTSDESVLFKKIKQQWGKTESTRVFNGQYEYKTYRTLVKLLEPILPDCFDELRKLINLKTRVGTDEIEIIIDPRGFIAHLNLRATRINQLLTALYENDLLYLQNRIDAKPEYQLTAQDTAAWNHFMNQVSTRYHSLWQKRPPYSNHKTFIDNTLDDLAFMFDTYLPALHQFYRLDAKYNALEFLMNLANLYREQTIPIAKALLRVAGKHTALSEEFTRLLLDSTDAKATITKLQANALNEDILNQLANSAADSLAIASRVFYSRELPVTIVTEEDVEQTLNDIALRCGIAISANEPYIKALKTAINCIVFTVPSETVTEKFNETLQEYEQERDLFLTEKASMTKAFKQKVATLRDQKEQQRLLAAKEKRSVSKKEETVTLKNETMLERLAQLKPKKLQMIKDILQFSLTIKYEDVVNLIKKHLKGEVNQTEGGSSHTQIRIDKCFCEMKASEEGKKPISPQVTGGMFKESGTAHRSGYLSRANLEHLGKLFLQSGITVALIDELLAKKSLQPPRP